MIDQDGETDISDWLFSYSPYISPYGNILTYQIGCLLICEDRFKGDIVFSTIKGQSLLMDLADYASGGNLTQSIYHSVAGRKEEEP